MKELITKFEMFKVDGLYQHRHCVSMCTNGWPIKTFDYPLRYSLTRQFFYPILVDIKYG